MGGGGFFVHRISLVDLVQGGCSYSFPHPRLRRGGCKWSGCCSNLVFLCVGRAHHGTAVKKRPNLVALSCMRTWYRVPRPPALCPSIPPMPVDHAVDGTVVSDANDSHGGMRAVDIRGEGGGGDGDPLGQRHVLPQNLKIPESNLEKPRQNLWKPLCGACDTDIGRVHLRTDPRVLVRQSRAPFDTQISMNFSMRGDGVEVVSGASDSNRKGRGWATAPNPGNTSDA